MLPANPVGQTGGEDAEQTEQVDHKATPTTGEAEVPISTGSSSNDERFNKRMIDHLTSSLES